MPDLMRCPYCDGMIDLESLAEVGLHAFGECLNSAVVDRRFDIRGVLLTDETPADD